MKPLAACRLYTFVDTAYLHGRPVEVVAQSLCDGGSDLVQLRAKSLPLEQVRALAERVLPVTRRAGVRLVINDYPALALDLGAEVCHLGQEDFFEAGHRDTRELKGPNRTLELGLSTHSPDQARRAIAANADYIAVGPVFPTGTKPQARPVTLEYVRWAAAEVKLPWFAIGGITLANLDSVLEAGATRVCVVSAILNATGMARQCRQFRDRLPS